jgi:hypothetical protein
MTLNQYRPFIMHLLQNQPEAVDFDAWREGRMTFEEAVTNAAKMLFLSKQELQRKYDYIPAEIREKYKPTEPVYFHSGF